MKVKSAKTKIVAILGAVTIAALGGACIALSDNNSAYADTPTGYGQSFRNWLAYSSERGWNNDPNGLLYADGVYHMYYQYNWDKNSGTTANDWGHMSWGHATSSDLVHWQERPVALPEGTVGDDGYTYGMMFSGSAVYDENNTSGLFETDSDGKVAEGQGIVAVLTQPDDSKGGQRQILAYSKDGGESFAVHGEILCASDDGGKGDGEFRDPKVSWNEQIGKWLMAVGGGSIRTYTSENLLDWEYVGETGFWGECPDLSAFTVDGEQKYVLAMSPEDKPQSHIYNDTTRGDAYYPAEYYTVGRLTDEGRFIAEQPIKRLTYGIDCYAIQTFNNAPEGKVYGISWSASWKSVGEYKNFRESYNGGMTVAYELNLEKNGDEYIVTRNPVEGYEGLRGEQIKSFDGELKAGKNALSGVRADVADLQIELDFSGSSAKSAQVKLRSSGAEYVALNYDAVNGIIELDRTKSSQLAQDTALLGLPCKAEAPLKDGKLNLRILVDRAFVSVFVNDGEVSMFSAIFPSALSNSYSLIADGDISVNASVYAMNGIFGTQEYSDNLLMNTNDAHVNVGSTLPVIASSYASGFSSNDVTYTIVDGGDKVSLSVVGGIAYVTANGEGYAKIRAEYNGQVREKSIYVEKGLFNSDVNFRYDLGGTSYKTDGGYVLTSGGSDAFRFTEESAVDFTFSAELMPQTVTADAGALVFGVSENLFDYYVLTVGFKPNLIKLWRAGTGDLKVLPYDFDASQKVKITLNVNGGTVKAFVNDGEIPALVCDLPEYSGGRLGINVFDASIAFNNLKLIRQTSTLNGFNLAGQTVKSLVNIQDGYKLNDAEYTVTDGVLSLNDGYIKTLAGNGEYVFRLITEITEYDLKYKCAFAGAEISPNKSDYIFSDEITLSLSEETDVKKVLVDGEACEFSQDGTLVSLTNEVTSKLLNGEHTVQAFTSNGRPQTVITISNDGTIIVDDEETEESRTFFYIDIAIFSVAILGYAGFAIYKKIKKS